MAEQEGDERGKRETERRFGDFDARLNKVRAAREGARPAEQKAAQIRGRFGPGIQVGIELLAGVAGGALMGWGLDSWLDTSPWFFLLLFFLGAGAGMLNAWRYLRRFASPDQAGSEPSD